VKIDTKHQQKSEQVCFGWGHGLFFLGFILAALLLPGKNDSLLFIQNCVKSVIMVLTVGYCCVQQHTT